METRVERTLVKSAPELWELADDPELMGRWCAALLDQQHAVDVTVTAREGGRRLEWRASGAHSPVAIDLLLAGKGFGTTVNIVAKAEHAVPGDILESLLDELASPQRRPFART